MKSAPRTPTWLTVAAPGLLLVVALSRGLSRFLEPDVWWHLRVGEHVLDTHQLYGRDPWAHFMDRPYLASQWLAEAVAAQAYRWAGLGGVLWLRALAVLLLTVLVYAAARRTAGHLPAALATGLGLVGASGGFNPRPQLVSLVILALVVHAWMGTAVDLRPRWWLVPLYWLWACLHGLWMFGILLGVVTTLALAHAVVRSGSWRGPLLRLGILHAASVVVLALTPLGPRLLLSPFTVAGNAHDVADEWQATPVTNPLAVAALGLIVLTAVCWLLRPARRAWWQYAWLALATVLVLVMWRLVPLGVIIVAPLAAGALQPLLTAGREPVTRRERTGLAAATAVALVVAAVVCAGPQGSRAFAYPGSMTAIDADLSRAPSGSVVMVDFGVSGWLLWAHPDLTPTADLRMESYSRPYLHRYIDALAAKPGWQRYLSEVGAHYALLERESALSDALLHEGGWRAEASSGRFVLLASPIAR
ncbi:hypothetical protein RKE38_03140 [Phycicoccus sp. M110.8]|uniref:hypothetical protein n=1 Tax=Phycicoccus sp. M110.8 TaxID=3075433 RepID=UPI0028FD9EDE|nr:hypothetical protein [Phycicoccus sp. M110.8]MDU0312666.1 hypothetical protein [Phycicoccus sp. M110.8]